MIEFQGAKSGILYMIIGGLIVATAAMGAYIYDQSNNKADINIKLDLPKIGNGG